MSFRCFGCGLTNSGKKLMMSALRSGSSMDLREAQKLTQWLEVRRGGGIWMEKWAAVDTEAREGF